MSVLIWEWTYGRTTRKNIEEIRARPDPDTGAYGQIYRYDADKPACTATLTARGLDRGEADAQHGSVMTRNTSYTYTLADGNTITGIPFTCSERFMEGLDLLEVTVEIVRTDV